MPEVVRIDRSRAQSMAPVAESLRIMVKLPPASPSARATCFASFYSGQLAVYLPKDPRERHAEVGTNVQDVIWRMTTAAHHLEGTIVTEANLSTEASHFVIPGSSCEQIARLEARSLHDLVADEVFQGLVQECFGGPARVRRSTPNPEEPGEPEFELLMLTTTLPAAEANDKLIELFGEIEEQGSRLLRDAVIGLENPA